jgi:hypothetical protein
MGAHKLTEAEREDALLSDTRKLTREVLSVVSGAVGSPHLSIIAAWLFLSHAAALSAFAAKRMDADVLGREIADALRPLGSVLDTAEDRLVDILPDSVRDAVIDETRKTRDEVAESIGVAPSRQGETAQGVAE